MNVKFFIRNSFFLLLLIYLSQGGIYSQGSFIAKFSLFFIILISVYYLFKIYVENVEKPIFLNFLFLFLLLNLLGFLISLNYNSLTFSQVKSILSTLIVFFPVYYFSYKGYLDSKYIVKFFLFLVPFVIMVFYQNINNTLAERLSDNENVVVNTSYFFALLLPYLFLIKNKIYSITLLLCLSYFIIQGSKRGAFIILFLFLILYFFNNILENKRKLLFNLTFALMSASFISYIIYLYYISNQFFVDRWSEVDSGASGRDIIYENIFNAWWSGESILNFLFGYGFMSSINFSGNNNLSHNDWLEIIINFGLLGFLLYLFLFLSCFMSIFNKNIDFKSRIIIITISVIWLLKSSFSMYYMAYTSAILFVLLGYILGKANSLKNL